MTLKVFVSVTVLPAASVAVIFTVCRPSESRLLLCLNDIAVSPWTCLQVFRTHTVYRINSRVPVSGITGWSVGTSDRPVLPEYLAQDIGDLSHGGEVP
jgi:hypothetical protein